VKLDLSSNQLEGKLGTEFSRWPQGAFVGNAELCGSPLRGCGSGGGGRSSALHSASVALVSAAVTLAVVLLIIVLALMAVRRRGRRSGEMNCTVSSTSSGSANRPLVIKGSAGREFRWEVIMEATANLSDQFAIGSGGSGTVYRAELPTGETVAVKRIAHVDSDVLLHDKSFTREVRILGRIRHRHLVKLLGFVSCHDGSMLVYEFMENGSLYDWLHGGGGTRKKWVLSWEARLKVAAGLGKGVEYLHHDCVPRIMHRDIKSSNVLLDGDMEAHLGDFGLAKAVAEKRQAGFGKDCTESASCFAGSYGYIAPGNHLSAPGIHNFCFQTMAICAYYLPYDCCILCRVCVLPEGVREERCLQHGHCAHGACHRAHADRQDLQRRHGHGEVGAVWDRCSATSPGAGVRPRSEAARATSGVVDDGDARGGAPVYKDSARGEADGETGF
jgi:tRNA A-37 threonylcarbamoyl transferase component Bud32